jgi:hypothetical protein
MFKLDLSLHKQAGVLDAIAKATEERARKEAAAGGSGGADGPRTGEIREAATRDAYADGPSEEPQA